MLGENLGNREIDLPEIQSLDSREVVGFKLKEGFEKVGEAFILEDVAFEIEGLGGFPGALIKWWEKSVGENKICQIVGCLENRKAEAISVIGWTDGKEQKIFEGRVKGKIAEEPRGENGFGFDKIFIPEGESRTVGEMSEDEKNSFSWRKLALDKLNKFLTEKNG